MPVDLKKASRNNQIDAHATGLTWEMVSLGTGMRIAEAVEDLVFQLRGIDRTLDSVWAKINEEPPKQPTAEEIRRKEAKAFAQRDAAFFSGWCPTNNGPIATAGAGLPWAVYFGAKKRGVVNLTQLVALTAEDILSFNNVGPWKLEQTRIALNFYGLRLRGDEYWKESP